MFLVVIGIVLGLVYLINNEKQLLIENIMETGEKDMDSIISVSGFVADYTYIERDLIKEDFEDFVLGVSSVTVRAKLGEPNGNAGSGVVMPYYELKDGTFMCLQYQRHTINKRDENGELQRDSDNNIIILSSVSSLAKMFVADKKEMLELILGE